MTTKLSVSLSADDVALLDDLVRQGEASSRSGAIHVALEKLQDSIVERSLVAQFDAAMADSGDELEDWDAAAGDEL